MRTLVLINRKAGSGEATEGWQRIAPKLVNVLGARPSLYDESRDWRRPIEEAARAGPCLVTAAGGDGTVHRVANLLLALRPALRERTLLGAVGFGSSNDFHKPADEHSRFLGVPVRCWPRRTIRQNVLRVDYLDPAGDWHTEYAVASASVGVVALGNDLFNRRWGPVGACRSLGTAPGIWCASLAGVCRRGGIPVTLSVDGRPAYEGMTCLLGFYVNRHIGGGLSYPNSVDPGSPYMGISLLANVTVLRRVYLLGRAARGALPGPPHTLLWRALTSRCVLERPVLLEMDGEVTRAREIHVRLVPRALRVCA